MNEEKPTGDVIFPTGKNTISFSELSNWSECSYRHRLIYVKGLGSYDVSPYLTFGRAIHSACENYLKTRAMDAGIAKKIISDEFAENEGKDGFQNLGSWLQIADDLLDEFPSFFEETFAGWEYFAAEERLFESILGEDVVRFKGFIDGIIRVPHKNGHKWWIVDYKTCSWGWDREKKQSDIVQSQLRLYKHFWAKKHDIEEKDVRCGFILFKRSGKKGKLFELVPVSMGDVTRKRTLKVIDNMLASVRNGIAIKNRKSCKWCEFKDTEHCT